MNKETRIFIAGVFLLIIGAGAIAYNIHQLENEGNLAWWKYSFFLSGLYCAFKGYEMIKKTTEE